MSLVLFAGALLRSSLNLIDAGSKLYEFASELSYYTTPKKTPLKTNLQFYLTFAQEKKIPQDGVFFYWCIFA